VDPVSPLVWAEIALAVYAFITILVLTPTLGWGIVPWMGVYMLGFLYIAGLNVIQHALRTDSKKKPLQK
jgi:hypothetical protein